MPPGNRRIPTLVRTIDKTTAGACIDIARRVQHACYLAGDLAGSDAARQVARFIEAEVLAGKGHSEA